MISNIIIFSSILSIEEVSILGEFCMDKTHRYHRQ